MARLGTQHRPALARHADRRPHRDAGDLWLQPGVQELQLLRRLLERRPAGDLRLLVDRDRCRGCAPLARAARHRRLGDPAHRQLDLQLAGHAARGLALPDAQGERRQDRGRRRPDGHPRLPDAGRVPCADHRRTSSSPTPTARSAGSTSSPSSSDSAPSRSSSSPTSSSTDSSGIGTPGQVMDRRAVGAGRVTPTTSARSASGCRSRCSVWRHRPTTAWWIFAGAVAMLAMFLFASIPMMEKRSLERRPDYQDVIDRVSVFLPRPPEGQALTKPRVVVAGLGDSGLLTAINLARDCRRRRHRRPSPAWSAARSSASDSPGPTTGQQQYRVPFERFRKLDQRPYGPRHRHRCRP